MYFDYLVEIPKVKGKIYKQTRKDVAYVHFEYAKIYKPEKKYNIPKRTTIINVYHLLTKLFLCDAASWESPFVIFEL